MNMDRLETLTRKLVDRRGSRRTVLRVAGALALLRLHALDAPTASAAAVADARCPSPATAYGYRSHRFAQTFEAQHTGTLTRVTIYAVAAGSIKFEIRKTTRRGKPGKTVLASAQVIEIDRPLTDQTTPVTVEFTPGARVIKGERYALAIAGVAGSSPNVQANSDPGCAGALFDDNDLDNTFRRISGNDIVFATFVTKA